MIAAAAQALWHGLLYSCACLPLQERPCNTHTTFTHTHNHTHTTRSDNSTAGRTKCVNTFKGYECDCGAGYMRVTDKVRLSREPPAPLAPRGLLPAVCSAPSAWRLARTLLNPC